MKNCRGFLDSLILVGAYYTYSFAGSFYFVVNYRRRTVELEFSIGSHEEIGFRGELEQALVSLVLLINALVNFEKAVVESYGERGSEDESDRVETGDQVLAEGAGELGGGERAETYSWTVDTGGCAEFRLQANRDEVILEFCFAEPEWYFSMLADLLRLRRALWAIEEQVHGYLDQARESAELAS